MAGKKNFLEIVLMPIVVAAVGMMGTYFLTQQQQSSALAKADADRQVKILDIFAEKITSPNERERILGLRLLEAVDPDLASKLADAVAAGEKEESQVQRVAYEIASEAKAKARLEPRVYLHVKDKKSWPQAKSIKAILLKAGLVVPAIERVGQKVPKLNQLRFYRESEEPIAQKILAILLQNEVEITLQYIPDYEDSKAIRPMHFELWLANQTQ